MQNSERSATVRSSANKSELMLVLMAVSVSSCAILCCILSRYCARWNIAAAMAGVHIITVHINLCSRTDVVFFVSVCAFAVIRFARGNV